MMHFPALKTQDTKKKAHKWNDPMIQCANWIHMAAGIH